MPPTSEGVARTSLKAGLLIALAAMLGCDRVVDESEAAQESLKRAPLPIPPGPIEPFFMGGRRVTEDEIDVMLSAKVGPLFVMGDLDGDETIDQQDGMLIRNALRGEHARCPRAGDLNFDNVVSSFERDAVARSQHSSYLRLASYGNSPLACNASTTVVCRPASAFLGTITACTPPTRAPLGLVQPPSSMSR